MKQVLRSFYKDGKFHREAVSVFRDGHWTTEKPSPRKGFVRRITMDRYKVLCVSEWFPRENLPIIYDWGPSYGDVPADIRRAKNVSPYQICSRCKITSVLYRTAEYISRFPNGGVHVKSICTFNNWKLQKTGHNSSSTLSILRFIGAVMYDKKKKCWFPGPNSEKFLEIIEERSKKEDSNGDKA